MPPPNAPPVKITLGEIRCLFTTYLKMIGGLVVIVLMFAPFLYYFQSSFFFSILFGCFIITLFLWLWVSGPNSKRTSIFRFAYKNRLGLQGISQIKELRPQAVGLFWGAVDEFVYFADVLKWLKREGKSLADYLESEEHRAATLNDIYRLRDMVALALQEYKAEPIGEQSPEFVERREYFLSQTVPYEESKLLAWEAPLKEQKTFSFQHIRGHYALVYDANKAVIEIGLCFYDKGNYSVGWVEAGDQRDKPELIETLRGEDLTVKVIRFSAPKESGTFYISDLKRNIIERLPV